MSTNTIIPYGMSFKEWSDQNAINLWKFGPIPRADGDKDWQSWAASLLNLSSIHGIKLPSPYQFTDWRRWAAAFNLEMQTVNL